MIVSITSNVYHDLIAEIISICSTNFLFKYAILDVLINMITKLKILSFNLDIII